MLNQLLLLVQTASRPCRVEELSRALGAQPSAVEGMLETLVRRGRILALDSNSQLCGECVLIGKCDLPTLQGRRYAPVCPKRTPLGQTPEQETI